MANTQFIKQVIEPYIRSWLAEQFPGQTFAERDVPVAGGFFRFDGVSTDTSIIAQFSCSRSQTRSGNENFGGSRKLQNDIQSLKVVASPFKVLVFTNPRFMELVARRGHRLGLDDIRFLHCALPIELQSRLDEVLDAASKEQRSRIDDMPSVTASASDADIDRESGIERGGPIGARSNRLPSVAGIRDIDAALFDFPERVTGGLPFDQRVGYKSWKVPRKGKRVNWMQWNDGDPAIRIAFPNRRGELRTWKMFARFPDDFEPRGPWERPEPYDRAKDQYMPAGRHQDAWGCTYESLRPYLSKLRELEEALLADLTVSYRYSVGRYGDR